MMKLKTVLAAAVCCGALSMTAFAETDETGLGKTPIELPDSIKDQLASNDDFETEIIKSDPSDAAADKDAADTGVEGVAAAVGALVLAGAAVVLSRKKN